MNVSIKISPDQLSSSVMEILAAFSGATNDVLDHAAKTAAAHAVAELNIQSPELYGDYKKGWTMKTGKRAKVGGVSQVIVHNKTNYQLTHLLENGHAKYVYGRRISGSVRAIPHIEPIEKETIAEFEGLVRQGVLK